MKDISVNRSRLLRFFKELVRINSPSLREREIANYIKSFAQQFDIEYAEDKSSEVTGSNSNNIVLTLRGSRRKEPVFLAAHLDTVEPTEGIKIVQKDDRISTDGSTILGADDKAGVAVILELLAIFSTARDKIPTVQAIFTVAEEIGLVGARALDTSLIEARKGFVLDDHGDIGRVVREAPYHYIYKCEVTGKAAHAGIEPEKGINAIKASAWIIERIPNGRLGENYTANIGKIKGGKATNIVPDSTVFDFEVRSLEESQCLHYIAQVKEVCAQAEKHFGVKVQLQGSREYQGFKISPSIGLVQKFIEQCHARGIASQLIKSTGGSDANIFNEKGLTAVNVSVGMRKVHSKEEFIYTEDLYSIAEILKEVLLSE